MPNAASWYVNGSFLSAWMMVLSAESLSKDAETFTAVGQEMDGGSKGLSDSGAAASGNNRNASASSGGARAPVSGGGVLSGLHLPGVHLPHHLHRGQGGEHHRRAHRRKCAEADRHGERAAGADSGINRRAAVPVHTRGAERICRSAPLFYTQSKRGRVEMMGSRFPPVFSRAVRRRPPGGSPYWTRRCASWTGWSRDTPE